MNTVVTSSEEILKTSRELIRVQGWDALNIRSVAAACGVSIGSIYNYFASKEKLICAVVESIWCEIFHRSDENAVFNDTLACVAWLYGRMECGSKKYPDLFAVHSEVFVSRKKEDGKRLMYNVWHYIIDGLHSTLRRDRKIRPDAFNERFTVEKFANIIFSLMMSAMIQKDYDDTAVLEIVCRTLY